MFRLHIDKHSDLRLLEPRHAEELFAAVDRDRKVLREWLPWVDQTKAATDTHAFIVESLEKLARQQELTAGIWHRGRIAGVLGARLNPLAPSAEIGYWLGAEFQGRGLMTCAVRAVMEYLFEERGLHRVEIHCPPENVRSCAVPKRLGFRQEGILREAALLNGRYYDHCVFALLREEWRTQSAEK